MRRGAEAPMYGRSSATRSSYVSRRRMTLNVIPSTSTSGSARAVVVVAAHREAVRAGGEDGEQVAALASAAAARPLAR